MRARLSLGFVDILLGNSLRLSGNIIPLELPGC